MGLEGYLSLMESSKSKEYLRIDDQINNERMYYSKSLEIENEYE